MKPTLLVLAAGMGSRYGGNKQLDEVGPSGETIIDYSIYDAIRAGFGKIVFIIRRDLEAQVKERFFEKLKNKIELDYVFQELTNVPEGSKITPDRVKPWGTSHAVLVAENNIREPFGIINADDFYGYDSLKILHDFLVNNKEPDTYCIVGYKLGNTLSDHGYVNRGVCNVDSNGFLENIVEVLKIEKTDSGAKAPASDGGEQHFTGSETVSMNLFGFKPGCFNVLREDFRHFIAEHGMETRSELLIPNTLDRYIKKRDIRIKVLMSNDRWFGVTYREDKPYVVENIRKMVQEGVYPEKIYQ
jgi:dTDP-glucose pyrophosphorylase